jgi:hypothetical protein
VDSGPALAGQPANVGHERRRVGPGQLHDHGVELAIEEAHVAPQKIVVDHGVQILEATAKVERTKNKTDAKATPPPGSPRRKRRGCLWRYGCDADSLRLTPRASEKTSPGLLWKPEA